MPKVSPTESFLRYLALPEDESEFVELQHCAVVLVSHLDRLAAPYLPLSSNQKVNKLMNAIMSFKFVFGLKIFKLPVALCLMHDYTLYTVIWNKGK